MKKTLFLLALLMISSYGFSQDAKYGIRAGLNVSNLDFDPAPTFDNTHRNGFFIGFLAEYSLSETMSLAPEIQFSAEGAKDESLRVDYIQAPILLKFKLGEKMSIGAGPLVGIKIHEFEDGFNNFAFSALVGIEYMITEEIFIDARYSYGLSNIFDDDVIIEAINTNIQFGVGIKIH